MDSKIPLYISAVALFIAVVASLFFFNLTQKMNKTISGLKIDKNSLVNLGGKVDLLHSDLCTLSEDFLACKKQSNKKIAETVEPEVVLQKDDDIDVEEEDDDSDIEVSSVEMTK